MQNWSIEWALYQSTYVLWKPDTHFPKVCSFNRSQCFHKFKTCHKGLSYWLSYCLVTLMHCTERNHPQAFVSSAFYPLEFPTLDNSTPRSQPVPSISASAGRAGVGQGGGQACSTCLPRPNQNLNLSKVT